MGDFRNEEEELRQNIYCEKKTEYSKKSIKLREEFIATVINMTNLSFSDKKRRIQTIRTVRDLYYFLMSADAEQLINPVLRNGILVTFDFEFTNSYLFDDALNESNYVTNILAELKSVARAKDIKNKLFI